MSGEEKKKLISITKAAEYAKVSDRTLRYAAAKEYLKAEWTGSGWVTTKEHVDEWLKSDKHRNRTKS